MPSNSSECTEEQDQAIAHFYTTVLSCVLNNAHAISLPSLEDLEVDNTSIFSLTRDLITFVIRSSSSFGERERREEGRREEGEKEGGKEGGRREGGRKGGKEKRRHKRKWGKDSHSRTLTPTVYVRLAFMSSSTSFLRTVMPSSLSSISATSFSIYNTDTS